MIYSDNNKQVPHNFDLRGIKAGEWFQGCRGCWSRYPICAAGPSVCSRCNSEMRIYTVDDRDVREANRALESTLP